MKNNPGSCNIVTTRFQLCKLQIKARKFAHYLILFLCCFLLLVGDQVEEVFFNTFDKMV